MEQQPQSQSQRLTFEQKTHVALFMADLAAVTVMVLLRRHIGLRVLWTGYVLVLFALIIMTNPLDEESFNDTKATNDPFPYRTALPPDKPVRPGWLGVFAVVSLFAAGRQAILRQRELRSGIAWHTYHRGISYLSFLPFEASTLAKRVEPALCILAGFACWHWFSVALGMWLIFAGLSLRFVEKWIYKRQFRQTLDVMDATVESRNLSEIAEQFQQHPSSTVAANDDIEVIHTRLSPEVEALIARRKRAAAQANTPAATKNAPKPKELSGRQLFWRFFWGRHAYDWWQRRKER